jgi:hypothetical protein
LGDVIALLVVGHQHGAALVVDAVVGVVVTDALDGVARDLDVIHVRVGGDFAGQHHEAGIGQRLGGHAAAGILPEDRVENRVGNLVGYLVGVAFRDGFGGKEKVVRHLNKLLCRLKACISCAAFGWWSPGERFSRIVFTSPCKLLI